MEPGSYSLQDYLGIAKRRKWQMILPAALLLIVSVPVVFMLPSVYRSEATILIEDQDIPRDLVRSTVTSYAAQRVEVITQRVMATQNLTELINKMDLYPDLRTRTPMSVLAKDMREDFSLELIEADVIDGRSGQAKKATIAFKLTFDHRNPRIAQAVVNEFVSLYLAENVRARRQKAAGAKEFLTKETEHLGDRIDVHEANLANFKERNAGNLPEHLEINLQQLRRSESEIVEIKRRIQVIRERKIYLNSELVQLDPYLPTSVNGPSGMGQEERLQVLQTQLISFRASYGPNHPDVRRLSRELDALSEETALGETRADLERQHQKVESELAEMRQRYNDNHPDVVKLERRLSAIDAALKDARNRDVQRANLGKFSNPAYVRLQTELSTADSEIKALSDAIVQLNERMALYEEKALKTPQIEREYLLLKRNYDIAIATYKDVKVRLREAELGETLELERRSERFSLIEPANRPDEPVKPNRPAFFLVAVVFSLSLGAGSGAFFEALDHRIYGPKQLASVTGRPPLVVIPYLTTPGEIRSARTRRIALALGFIVFSVVAVYIVDEVFGPLDVLWARAERRLDLLISELGIL